MSRSPLEAPSRPVRRAVSDIEKASRRSDILSAAKATFAEKGYHATTIADIAKAAGLSYGSIYWYYESKDTLFRELMSAEATALRMHIDAAVRASRDEAAQAAPLRAAVRATLEFYDEDKALVKLLFRDAFALGKVFERHLYAIHASFVEDAERLVVSAERQGVFVDRSDRPPKMTAFSITALVGQFAHRRLVTDDGMSAAAAADFVVDLLLDGLLPRPIPVLSGQPGGVAGSGKE